MARILKWQERLMLACAALLFSVTSGLGLGPRDSAAANRPSSSRVVIVGKSGVELMAHKPYLRLIRASFASVSLPLATGAYLAMADAVTAADGTKRLCLYQQKALSLTQPDEGRHTAASGRREPPRQ